MWAYAKRDFKRRLVHFKFLKNSKKLQELILDCIDNVSEASMRLKV